LEVVFLTARAHLQPFWIGVQNNDSEIVLRIYVPPVSSALPNCFQHSSRSYRRFHARTPQSR
jgi:hypothetical protein